MIRRLRSLGRRLARAAGRTAGIAVVRYRPDHVSIPAYLCPSAHKLYDFRKEPGFAELADEVIAERRTFLKHNRLLTLWQTIQSTRDLTGDVAEVGSYRGGSARFIASTLEHFEVRTGFHVFDTFEGHPDGVVGGLDGLHQTGSFSKTSYEEVKAYLARFGGVQIHKGPFAETNASVSTRTFRMVHVDVDVYQSSMDCFTFFWPRMVDGGVLVIDDYGFTTCQGMRQAVKEFFAPRRDHQSWYLHTGQYLVIRRNPTAPAVPVHGPGDVLAPGATR